MTSRPRTADLRLGFFEKLGLLPIFAAVLGKTFWTVLTAKFIPKHKRPSSFARLLGYTAIRTLLSKNTSRTEQASAVGSEESYMTWCKHVNAQPVTETLNDGTNAYWVGPKDADYVLIYFHGGGYTIPAYIEHFALLHSLTKALPSLSALLLHYDTTPFAAYPRQLAQATALLTHVLATTPPSRILLAGDSAGANLALGLLSHILHPHPEIPHLTLPTNDRGETEKLKAVVLLSPWTSFDTTTASFTHNATRDFLSPVVLTRWSTLFLAGKPTDPYNQPVDVPAGWWRGVGEGVVCDVLFVGGEYEVLLDGILNCAESVRNEWGGEGEVECVVVEGEGHDSAWVDTMLGFGHGEIGMFGVVRDWVGERL